MKLGVVMDPIGSIDFKKDSTLAILLEAQARNHEIYYMEPSSLFLKEDGAFGLTHSIEVKDDSKSWYNLSEIKDELLHTSANLEENYISFSCIVLSNEIKKCTK